MISLTVPNAYASTSAGLAAVETGQVFWVQGSQGSLELHQEVDEAAILLGVFDTASATTLSGNGAVADAVELRDAGMTAASAELQSASASFSAADVGKTIVVAGAGGAGDRLRTTISAYTSATQVTLAIAAETTVSAEWAVYGTDCSAAFQSALDALAASMGGTLVIDGLYLLTEPVSKGFGGEAGGVKISIVGFGSNSALWVGVPTAQDAITLDSAAVTFRDLFLVGVQGLTADARRIIDLTGVDATFERCSFMGLLGAQGIIYATGSALRTRRCNFGGSMVLGSSGSVYASIENKDWIAYSDEDSQFIDYGYFRARPYSRTGNSGNLSWIRADSPTTALGARAESVFRLKGTRLDEGSMYGVDIRPTAGRIHSAILDGVRINVTPFLDGRGTHCVNVDSVEMNDCVAGWSSTGGTRFAHFENCTNVVVKGQQLDTPEINHLSATNVSSLTLIDPPAGLTQFTFANVKYHPVSSQFAPLAIIKNGAISDSDFGASPAGGTQGFDNTNGRLYVKGRAGWVYFNMDGGTLKGPNLVVNGDFSSGTTTGWTPFNGGTLSVVSGALRVTNGAIYGLGYQVVATVPGVEYEVSVNIIGGTAGRLVRIGTTGSAATYGQLTATGVGTVTFTATTTTTYISLMLDNEVVGKYADFDSIELRVI